MKTYRITFLFIIALLNQAIAQIQEGGIPLSITPDYSGSIPRNVINDYIITPLNNEDLLDQAEQEFNNSGKFMYAKDIEVNIDLFTYATYENLPEGELYRLKLNSTTAKGMQIFFDNFSIPQGASLFIYSENLHDLLGAFTSNNNKADLSFMTGPIYSGSVILEYLRPIGASGSENLNIASIAHIFQTVNTSSDDFGPDVNDPFYDNSCLEDVICNDYDISYKKEVSSVVKLYLIEDGLYYHASGVMINNTHQDGAPLLLTAGHNHESGPESDFKKWVFYFNHESPGCGFDAKLAPKKYSINGANKITQELRSLSGDPENLADYLLLSLHYNIPRHWNVCYAGWDATNSFSGINTAVVHHPYGDVKKINFVNGQPTIGLNNPKLWAVPGYSSGTTYKGSSGSPLYDSFGRVKGVLSSGATTCTTPTNYDLFGMFKYLYEDPLALSYLDPFPRTFQQSIPSYCNNCNDEICNGDEDCVTNPTLPYDCGGSCVACEDLDGDPGQPPPPVNSFYDENGFWCGTYLSIGGWCIPKDYVMAIDDCLKGRTNGQFRNLIAQNFVIGGQGFHYEGGKLGIQADNWYESYEEGSIRCYKSGIIRLDPGFKFINGTASDEIRIGFTFLQDPKFYDRKAKSCYDNLGHNYVIKPCPNNSNNNFVDNSINGISENQSEEYKNDIANENNNPNSVQSNIDKTFGDFSIFPNPNNGSFVISPGNLFFREINIMDFTGKNVEILKNVDENVLINLNVANGVYMIKFTTNTGSTFFEKIFINESN